MRLERERKTLKLLATEALGYRALSNLAKLICSGQDMEWLYLVMPACLGGDLHMLLDQVSHRLKRAVAIFTYPHSTTRSTMHSLTLICRPLKPHLTAVEGSLAFIARRWDGFQTAWFSFTPDVSFLACNTCTLITSRIAISSKAPSL